MAYEEQTCLARGGFRKMFFISSPDRMVCNSVFLLMATHKYQRTWKQCRERSWKNAKSDYTIFAIGLPCCDYPAHGELVLNCHGKRLKKENSRVGAKWAESVWWKSFSSDVCQWTWQEFLPYVHSSHHTSGPYTKTVDGCRWKTSSGFLSCVLLYFHPSYESPQCQANTSKQIKSDAIRHSQEI